MRAQKNFFYGIYRTIFCIIILINLRSNYSEVLGSEFSEISEMQSLNQQLDFVNKLVVEREQSRQKQLEQERLHRKLREQGVPSTVKTGRDLLEEKFSASNINSDDAGEIMDSKTRFHGVMEELKDRHEELYEKIIATRYSLPVSEYHYSLLTPEIAESIPAPLIHAQAFNPSDDPFTMAIKLERFGLIIKDLSPLALTPEAYEKKRRLMGRCFALAGSHVSRAVRLVIENPNTKIDLDALKDMYQTGGLLYHWAALNMSPQLGSSMNQFSDNFYNGLDMILLMYEMLESSENSQESDTQTT